LKGGLASLARRRRRKRRSLPRRTRRTAEEEGDDGEGGCLPVRAPTVAEEEEEIVDKEYRKAGKEGIGHLFLLSCIPYQYPLS
jgi:hypothetical protein